MSLVALGLQGEEQSLELTDFKKYIMAVSGMSLLLRKQDISFKEIITAQECNIYLLHRIAINYPCGPGVYNKLKKAGNGLILALNMKVKS